MTTRSIARQLQASQKIGLIIHRDPDGDAIGSGRALELAFLTAGKEPVLICVSDPSPTFEQVVGRLKIKKSLPPDCDTYLLLDCGDLARTGFSRQLRALAKKGRLILSLDHHSDSDLEKITRFSLVNTQACATTEIVFGLLTELHQPITGPIATALLLGIYTDTGGFTHSNTSSRALQLASRLIYYGANLRLISQTFERQQPSNRRKLWATVCSEVEINPLGIVIARVTAAHFLKTKTGPEDVSGLANMLSLIEEARAALVLIEEEGQYRGVFRTRYSHINLGRLARLLGGRGQKRAAGFSATKPLFSGKIKNT